MALIFIDCEAVGLCPRTGVLTEFGAVEFKTKRTFHGIIYKSTPDPKNPTQSLPVVDKDLSEDPKVVFTKFAEWLEDFGLGRHVMVSDNPAYDFQWINDGFAVHLGYNPLGHSARRISDFYAGLVGNFYQTQSWKKLRITPHDHNPVNDAMGNVEAFERLLEGER